MRAGIPTAWISMYSIPVLLDLSKGRARQKERFGGELFPNVTESGWGLVFAEFFRNDRDTVRKGIVVLKIGESA
jgi:hypothetical protein